MCGACLCWRSIVYEPRLVPGLSRRSPCIHEQKVERQFVYKLAESILWACVNCLNLFNVNLQTHPSLSVRDPHSGKHSATLICDAVTVLNLKFTGKRVPRRLKIELEVILEFWKS